MLEEIISGLEQGEIVNVICDLKKGFDRLFYEHLNRQIALL